MSEYEQTQRRFEKLKATFDKLIEQNSYKALRKRNEELAKKFSDTYSELEGLQKRFDAQARIIKSLEAKLNV